jgi:hypothetical protein
MWSAEQGIVRKLRRMEGSNLNIAERGRFINGTDKHDVTVTKLRSGTTSEIPRKAKAKIITVKKKPFSLLKQHFSAQLLPLQLSFE